MFDCVDNVINKTYKIKKIKNLSAKIFTALNNCVWIKLFLRILISITELLIFEKYRNVGELNYSGEILFQYLRIS